MPFNALVLAQSVTPSSGTTQSNAIYLAVVIVLGFVLPILAGRFFAKQFRAADYGWKISLVFVLLALAAMTVGRSWDSASGTFKIPLGVDLKGGVILIYEVDEEASLASEGADAEAGEGRFQMDKLISALSRRINPSGTKEIVLRKYGERQVEIIIPEVDPLEVDVIKKKISTAGMLKFRIVANRRDHDEIISLAKEMAEDPARKRSAIVRDAGGRPVGLWARVAREQAQDDVDRRLKLPVSSNDLVRDASTGELIDLPSFNERDSDREIAALEKFLAERGTKEIDVLMATDDGYNVEGKHLGVVSPGKDERLNPCINFALKGEGIDLFADLTRDNKPDGNFHRQLGILLDNELLSAPNIQEMINRNGRITGKFTQAEVSFLVNILDAGSLPVVLNTVPISESVISPLLGQQTIEQGKWAIVISLVTVLAFILVYYRFSGVVASLALLANLLFIVAMMITLKAAFTLPGLAGLVLTVGMSVDANVLIFERIREEIAKGSAFRMAIRNGFSRATTTIIDANVTTLITAIVLYAIGTDQIRGFAVTLILGILMSMFTAIFCSRIAFDLAEKSRRLSLSMSQFLGATQFDFIGKRMAAGAFSLCLIVAGIAGLALRGVDIFDIDFRGGTSVQLTLDEPMKTDDIRKRFDPKFKDIGQQYTITAMNAGGKDANLVFKVDSGIGEVEDLQQTIQEALEQPGGKSPMATYALSYGALQTKTLARPATRPAAATKDGSDDREASPGATGAAPAATSTPAGPAAEAPAEAPVESPVESPAKSPAEAPVESTGDAPPRAEDAPPKTAPPATPVPGDGAASLPAVDNLLALADDLETLIAQADTDAAADQPATAADTSESQPSATEASPTQAPDSENENEIKTEKQPAAETKPEQPTPVADPPTEQTPEGNAPEEKTPADTPATDTGTGEPAAPAGAPPAASTQIEVQLEFAHEINYDTLRAMIAAAMETQGKSDFFELQNPDWQGGSNAFKTWTLQIPGASEEETKQLLEQLQTQFAKKPVWRSSSKIGGQVAGQMKRTAVFAFLTCLLGIVLYIWIRFQHVIFGLAAVVALIHDVLVTLGAIALSYWLAGAFGFLLIEEFKISLPIVAALLTIIGYSLNDTIVVFDRIREVRGKSPELTGDMINASINQTLSRTILTSFTTLIVVLILYAIGGDGIHGFAFALVVGVTVGTYSSIFVASPVLLWMTGANKSRQRSRAA